MGTPIDTRGFCGTIEAGPRSGADLTAEGAMEWIYENNADNTARFALGQVYDPAGRTLLCFGINPSTACPERPDNTIRKVISIARHNGYDNWIMLNVYPQRATSPDDLHPTCDGALARENLARIAQIAEAYPDCDVWLAYGNLIAKRPYLRTCLEEILSLLQTERGKRVKIIKLTKANNPVHPLYQKNEAVLVDCAI